MPSTIDTVTEWFGDYGRFDSATALLIERECALALAGTLPGMPLALTVSPGDSTRYDLAVFELTEPIADSLGGQFMVTLPRLGRCRALSLHNGPWLPAYVADVFDLRPNQAIIYAAVLTILGGMLAVAP